MIHSFEIYVIYTHIHVSACISGSAGIWSAVVTVAVIVTVMEDVYQLMPGRRDGWEGEVEEGGVGWRGWGWSWERASGRGHVKGVMSFASRLHERTSDQSVALHLNHACAVHVHMCSCTLCISVCVCIFVRVMLMNKEVCVLNATIPPPHHCHHCPIIPFLLPIFSLSLDWTVRDNLGLERAVRPGALLIHFVAADVFIIHRSSAMCFSIFHYISS